MAREDTPRRLFVAVTEADIEERIDAAREKWAVLTGEPVDEVPWHVVFISDRPLTRAQCERGAQIAADYGLDKQPVDNPPRNLRD